MRRDHQTIRGGLFLYSLHFVQVRTEQMEKSARKHCRAHLPNWPGVCIARLVSSCVRCAARCIVVVVR